MPIYEYQCGACGHQLETIQKFSDAPLTECPACGKPALQKMLSAPAFQLKGSGWYQTDFKGMGQKKPSVSSATAKDTSTDKPVTETKTAAEIKTAAPAGAQTASAASKPASGAA